MRLCSTQGLQTLKNVCSHVLFYFSMGLPRSADLDFASNLELCRDECMVDGNDDAVLVHKGRGDLTVQGFTIAGAATKMLGIGSTGILRNPTPLALLLAAKGDGSGILRRVSMEEELIPAHVHP